MTAVEIPTVDGEVVEPLEEADASRLDKRLRLMASTTRGNIVKLADLVADAKRGQVHVVLGFPSWTAYVADAVGGKLDLSSAARREVVALMSGEGMSERAIAAAVGVSQPTVHRDIRQVIHDESPDAGDQDAVLDPPHPDDGPSPADPPAAPATVAVMGRDGKSYPKSQPRQPRRKPFEDDVRRRSSDLLKMVEKVVKLGDDDRFDAYLAKNSWPRRDLVAAITCLQKLADRIPDDSFTDGREPHIHRGRVSWLTPTTTDNGDR